MLTFHNNFYCPKNFHRAVIIRYVSLKGRRKKLLCRNPISSLELEPRAVLRFVIFALVSSPQKQMSTGLEPSSEFLCHGLFPVISSLERKKVDLRPCRRHSIELNLPTTETTLIGTRTLGILGVSTFLDFFCFYSISL